MSSMPCINAAVYSRLKIAQSFTPKFIDRSEISSQAVR